MLRRMISLVLVVSLIGWGTSWAYSGHVLDDVDHPSLGVHEHTQPAEEETACDHCCHMSAHMTGVVTPRLPSLAVRPVDIYSLDARRVIDTRYLSPLLKPPRS